MPETTDTIFAFLKAIEDLIAKGIPSYNPQMY